MPAFHPEFSDWALYRRDPAAGLEFVSKGIVHSDARCGL